MKKRTNLPKSATLSGLLCLAITLQASDAARIWNVSGNGYVGNGDYAMIGGVTYDQGIYSNSGMVRGVGSELLQFGVYTPLNDPFLQIFDQSDLLLSNDDWEDVYGSLISQVTAGITYPLDAGSTSSAVLFDQLPSGAYSTILSDAGMVVGNGMLEWYDLSTKNSINHNEILHASHRAFVSESNPFTQGFIIEGEGDKTLLLRAVGEKLGELAPGLSVNNDLKLTVWDLSYSPPLQVTSNDDWGNYNDQAQLIISTLIADAYPLNSGSGDAAVVVELEAGSYSVVVESEESTAGLALVEIWSVD